VDLRRTYRCYYKAKGSPELLQEFVTAPNKEEAIALLDGMGVFPEHIEEVQTVAIHSSRASSHSSEHSGYQSRPLKPSGSEPPKVGMAAKVVANSCRLVAAFILLGLTVFVNEAGYAFGAWLVGVAIILPTVLPLLWLAEKMDPRK
jgi:hypothetical protein